MRQLQWGFVKEIYKIASYDKFGSIKGIGKAERVTW